MRVFETANRPAFFLYRDDLRMNFGTLMLFSRAARSQIPADALAHCIGSVLVAPLYSTSLEQYRDCMAADLDSAFFTLLLGVRALRVRAAQRPGAAVFMSSAAARIGTPNHEVVAAARGGLESLVRAAAATA